MGNTLTGVSKRLTTAIENDKIWAMSLTDSNAITLDFSHGARDTYDPSLFFQIFPMERIPSQLKIILLFSSQKMIIHSEKLSSSIETINNVINANIARDQKDVIQMSICWMDYIFNVKNVRGNLYLVWTRDIIFMKRTEDGRDVDDQVQRFGGDIPVLMETNGEYKQKYAYPLAIGDSVKQQTFMCGDSIEIAHSLKTMKLYPHDKKRPQRTPDFPKISEVEKNVLLKRDIIPPNEKERYLEKVGCTPDTPHKKKPSKEWDYVFDDNEGPRLSHNVTDGGDEDDRNSDVEEIDDDEVNNFFNSVDTPGSVDGITNNVLQDAKQSMVNFSFESENSVDSEFPQFVEGEGDGVYHVSKDSVSFEHPLPSFRRRMHVPSGLVYRHSDRNYKSNRTPYRPKQQEPVGTKISPSSPPPQKGISNNSISQEESVSSSGEPSPVTSDNYRFVSTYKMNGNKNAACSTPPPPVRPRSVSMLSMDRIIRGNIVKAPSDTEIGGNNKNATDDGGNDEDDDK